MTTSDLKIAFINIYLPENLFTGVFLT